MITEKELRRLGAGIAFQWRGEFLACSMGFLFVSLSLFVVVELARQEYSSLLVTLLLVLNSLVWIICLFLSVALGLAWRKTSKRRAKLSADIVERSERRIALPTGNPDRAESVTLPEQLEVAYDHLDELYAEAHENYDNDPSIRTRIDSSLEKLRVVQTREARRLRQTMEDSLSMRLGGGRGLRDRLGVLRAQYGDPPASDPAT